MLHTALLSHILICGRKISPLRRRPKGFPVIVAPLSTSAFGGLATGEASPFGNLQAASFDGYRSIMVYGNSALYCSHIKRLLCRRQRFRACGRDQRAFRSPFGNLRSRPFDTILLMQHSIRLQSPRRGAPVARRDPCKGKTQAPNHQPGSREGRRPFAGFPKGQRPFGRLSGQRPDRESRGQRPLGVGVKPGF